MMHKLHRNYSLDWSAGAIYLAEENMKKSFALKQQVPLPHGKLIQLENNLFYTELFRNNYCMKLNTWKIYPEKK